jgi:hypothetical protein
MNVASRQPHALSSSGIFSEERRNLYFTGCWVIGNVEHILSLIGMGMGKLGRVGESLINETINRKKR